jgi:hypothetical protein
MKFILSDTLFTGKQIYKFLSLSLFKQLSTALSLIPELFLCLLPCLFHGIAATLKYTTLFPVSQKNNFVSGY